MDVVAAAACAGCWAVIEGVDPGEAVAGAAGGAKTA